MPGDLSAPASASPALGAIRAAASPADIARVRALFEAYAQGLGVSLCFQGFDAELATLPGDYAPPRGGLWLAAHADVPLGCIALRPLHGGDGRIVEGEAELKRLYVAPAARGTGLGRALAQTATGFARAAGYRAIRLDTLAGMDAARALYADLGFRPCAAYYRNPLGGTLYLELRL